MQYIKTDSALQVKWVAGEPLYWTEAQRKRPSSARDGGERGGGGRVLDESAILSRLLERQRERDREEDVVTPSQDQEDHEEKQQQEEEGEKIPFDIRSYEQFIYQKHEQSTFDGEEYDYEKFVLKKLQDCQSGPSEHRDRDQGDDYESAVLKKLKYKQKQKGTE